jgi:hypothetical protein
MRIPPCGEYATIKTVTTQEEQAYLEDHAYHLGSLLANFQSLEFGLRSYLQSLPHAPALGVPHGQDIYAVPIGGQVPENAFTNYDSLGVLISKYNEAARQRSSAEIDPSLVEIRDALAHGRVSAQITDDTLRLLKFSRPKNGIVEVTFNALLSRDWFLDKKKRVCDALLTVGANLTPPATR